MGAKMPNGAIRIAPNSYHYTKVEGKWRLTHHLIAEETIGRPIKKGERVTFRDGDRTNLDPLNIAVKETKGGRSGRIQYLKERIARDQEELSELESENK
jgi:hypothetical protein